jgi:hypothetical protein
MFLLWWHFVVIRGFDDGDIERLQAEALCHLHKTSSNLAHRLYKQNALQLPHKWTYGRSYAAMTAVWCPVLAETTSSVCTCTSHAASIRSLLVDTLAVKSTN